MPGSILSYRARCYSLHLLCSLCCGHLELDLFPFQPFDVGFWFLDNEIRSFVVNFQPFVVDFRPFGIKFQPFGIKFQPFGIKFQPFGIKFQPFDVGFWFLEDEFHPFDVKFQPFDLEFGSSGGELLLPGFGRFLFLDSSDGDDDDYGDGIRDYYGHHKFH
ncbi:hypothetical protein QBC33DRAFT_560343 [Phialemonium atrogriseum]|uniref:Uncharacterized protein n=1 Tax=Phialemonium atrogriseum TaxID=1093897 RepID=A0AAJ0C1D3_9PEZI|nr:uncharacterized protein QBC33DRAFT_560343 [Phialemonium atrogriseum]KAK1765906.1 hypothetical protein QBC33DRAFT_560343 [Phialemonium atrogriseum]